MLSLCGYDVLFHPQLGSMCAMINYIVSFKRS